MSHFLTPGSWQCTMLSVEVIHHVKVSPSASLPNCSCNSPLSKHCTALRSRMRRANQEETQILNTS